MPAESSTPLPVFQDVDLAPANDDSRARAVAVLRLHTGGGGGEGR